MANRPQSVPERFVSIWARIEAMPAYEFEDSRRHVLASLKREAELIIETALDRAWRLTYIAGDVINDSQPKVNE